MDASFRIISKDDKHSIKRTLNFEAKSELFTITLKKFSIIDGTQRTRIDLNRQEASKLLDALQKFMKQEKEVEEYPVSKLIATMVEDEQIVFITSIIFYTSERPKILTGSSQKIQPL